MSSLTRVTTWLVKWKSSLVGAVERLLGDKLDDVLSVKDFGAVGDGVTDDTLAFSLAAKAAISSDITQSTYANVPHAKFAEVYVPPGKYLLSNLVDVSNKSVSWIAAGGANFINPDNLNGRLVRAGVRTNNFFMHGTLDNASGYSVGNIRGAETPAGVLGVSAPDQLAIYTDRDTVGLYAENKAPPILASTTTATYTINSTSISSALSNEQLLKLRVGMLIDTKHTPYKYTGVITGWNSDGSTIFVEGWYLADGISTTHAKVVPPSGVGYNLNPFTKAWAVNANVFLEADSHASAAVGFELGVSNNKFGYDTVTDSWHTWGYDVITLGSQLCETGYMQRGYFYKGYESRGAIGYGFLAANSGTNWANQAAYGSTNNADYQFLVKPDAYSAKQSFGIRREGSIEMGRLDTASTPSIAMRSSGLNNSFDVLMQASGGSATSGEGLLTVTAGTIIFSNGFWMTNTAFRPNADNLRNLGAADKRWNTLFCATGTINTSDTRLKKFLDIDEAEKVAAGQLAKMFRKYQFKDAIDEKGVKARIHFGVGAQEVIEVLKSNGLNWEDYAFVCYDAWEESREEIKEPKEVSIIYKDEDGTEITTSEVMMIGTGKYNVTPAGDRYGIRYEELLCFILSVSLNK